jgi:hypothetical protein
MLCLSAWLGTFVGRISREPDEKAEHDIGVVLAATLTLLGLIIGFSFSMAISRYDQRRVPPRHTRLQWSPWRFRV